VIISARRLAWAQRLAAAAICLYWILFAVDHGELPANVVDVEWAFLLPDLVWIALAFLVASGCLLSGDRRAEVASAVAGGSMVYLGFLDIMLNVRHGQYTISLARGLLNAAVNGSCLVFGLANIWFALSQTRPVPGDS